MVIGADSSNSLYRSAGRYMVNGTVRVTVYRTGGGYGTVGVKYGLRHGTTDGADVTASAHYTTRCDRRLVIHRRTQSGAVAT